ncbi:unnamed protein product [Parnassius apollo]|uniref:Fidgetin-like protein 1 n=1 Tax=Parnassius apollo TaxID=110799 RepID=A0A8S3XCB2_PARAO|nr:unnamed protein product [Parnassius apollo]
MDTSKNEQNGSKYECFDNSLQLYMQSVQSSSNLTSINILNDLWQTKKDIFNRESQLKILNTAKALTKNSNTLNIKTWKSSLSKINDPVSLVEKSMTLCKKCSMANNYNGYKKFIANKCNCDTCLFKISSNKRESSIDSKSTVNNTYSNSSSQDKFVAEQKGLFKPKSKLKQFPRISVQPQMSVFLNNIETNSRSDVNTNYKFEFGTNLDRENISHQTNLDREEEENKAHKSNVAKITFKTAKEALLASNPAAKRTLGASRKAQGKFIPPMLGAQEKQERSETIVTDDRLKHIDAKMIELIESEIIDKGTPVGWDDIAGLQMAKSVIQEAVVWPLLRPDIFTGLRRPPKGILLFGPPGTGKTLIGKCVAAQCRATFFSISASSLTSKWLGDGEKMVRALFAVARCHQPAVIFIDEIDSLLTQRSDSEHEATRRIKTEFLVQFDGAATGEEDRLLIVGATNRPQELDEAARRRLVKRLYIPLPDLHARQQIISNLLKDENNDLTCEQVVEIAALTEGYSGADMKSLCSEAAMGPIRSVPLSQIINIDRDKVRPVNSEDFINALQRVRPSVSQDDLGQYVKWNSTYGQGF